MSEPRNRKKAEESKEEKSTEQKKCFVIMPFTTPPSYKEADHFQKVYNTIIKPAIKMAGFEPERVDEDKICDSIIDKIWKNIIECDMAICDLSGRKPNVMYELGIRQAYDKPVVLIQDDVTERIFDVSAISTVKYSSERIYEKVQEDQKIIAEAIKETYEGKMPSSLISTYNLLKAETKNSEVSKEEQIFNMLRSMSVRLERLEDKGESNKNVINEYSEPTGLIQYRRYMRKMRDIECRLDRGVTKNEIDELDENLQSIKLEVFLSKDLSSYQRIGLKNYASELENKLIKIKVEISE
ncbi:hypothetical protein [Ruminococcus flavefaciens]|uniref:hypothetical protein n=1 Tax=Ruminococcus flavefaciens TaxID=1265 RepID=UPI0004B2A944|nr:hypothetical protein [Ruminococcus flavefaciens]